MCNTKIIQENMESMSVRSQGEALKPMIRLVEDNDSKANSVNANKPLQPMIQILPKETLKPMIKLVEDNDSKTNLVSSNKPLQPMIQMLPKEALKPMIKFVEDNDNKVNSVNANKPLQPMIQILPEYDENKLITSRVSEPCFEPEKVPIDLNLVSQYTSVIPIPPSVPSSEKISLYHFENSIGRAEKLISVLDMEICYVQEDKYFIYWNDKIWEHISELEIKKSLYSIAKMMCLVNHNTPDMKETKQLGEFNVIKQTVEVMKSILGISKSRLNAVRKCICVKNGVFNFRDGTLHSHSEYKYAYITKMIDIDYYPMHHDNVFDTFISDIMVDYDNAKCLQRIFGYPLLGEPNEQVAFILSGSGANGKSTLISALQNVVGKLSTVVNIEYFTSNVNINPQAPSPATYQLMDKYYAFTSEGKAGSQLNDNTVKKLIGGGKLSARQPYCGIVEFDAKFVLFFDTNHVPHFKDGGYSMERRIVIVPFPVTFKGDKINKNLGALLQTENAQKAILSWLINGAMEYQQKGFLFTDRIKDETKSFFENEDTIANFMRDCTYEAPDGKVSIKVLYNYYEEYCLNCLMIPKNKDAFVKSEPLKKYKSKRSGRLGRYKEGIKLKKQMEENDETQYIKA